MSIRSLMAGGVVAAFAILLLLLQGALADRDTARRAATAAEVRTVAAEAQGDLNGAAARAVEAAQARELTITFEAKEAAHDVAEAAGGEAAVPAGVLDRWAGAIDRLRDEAGAGARPASADRSADIEGALPATVSSAVAERG